MIYLFGMLDFSGEFIGTRSPYMIEHRARNKNGDYETCWMSLNTMGIVFMTNPYGSHTKRLIHEQYLKAVSYTRQCLTSGRVLI